MRYGYSVRNEHYKEVVHHKPDTDEFYAVLSTTKNAWGYSDFAKRSTIMKSLVNGSLVIEI